MTSYPPIILWLSLIVAFCTVLALHLFENRKIKINLQKRYDADLVKQIINFHWSRSIQLFFIMGFSFLLIALYDLQTRNILELLETEQNARIIRTALKPETSIQQIIPQNEALYPNKHDSLTKSIQNNIQDVFEVEDGIINSETTIDNIKKRYEEALVTYFFLQKCQKTKDSDYQLIFLSLQKEITNAKAQMRLQYDILTAAKGSYDELYSKNDCSRTDMENIINQYNVYMDTLQAKINNN